LEERPAELGLVIDVADLWDRIRFRGYQSNSRREDEVHGTFI
jgi:hypothetical protein